MAKEKIATNLLGRAVTSNDPRIHKDGRAGWPLSWPKLEDSLAPGQPVRTAEVVGVFVEDGSVKLVLRCLNANLPLHVAYAIDWIVCN